MEGPNARRTAHLFRVAMLVKGIDGAAELIVAMVLLLVSTATVHRLVADVLARDLLGSADGRLARHVVTITDGFATGNRTFAVVYLALHGVVKLALVLALLRNGCRPTRWRSPCSAHSSSTRCTGPPAPDRSCCRSSPHSTSRSSS